MALGSIIADLTGCTVTPAGGTPNTLLPNALAGAVQIGQIGAPNGVAGLDANGNISIALLTASLVQLMKTLPTTLPGTTVTLYLNGDQLSISSTS